MFINHLSLLFHNFYDGLNTENGNFHKFYWALTKASITLFQPEVFSLDSNTLYLNDSILKETHFLKISNNV
jgi:hypothetical protein